MTDTLATAVSHTAEVKHSRFIVHAVPIDTPQDALNHVDAVSDPAATHNCWAYRLGGEYRSSDDGEPAGTAGRPILAAIDGQGYDRVVAVVTRWFGGIKLGAGGLVRAYGGVAAECLRLAPRQPLIEMRTLELACVFDDLGIVHAAMAAFSAEKSRESFDAEGARLLLSLPASQATALKTRLRDATRNRICFMDEAP